MSPSFISFPLFVSLKDYTVLETTNSSSFATYPSSTWQPSTSTTSGASYWTNQMTPNVGNTSSPTPSTGIQNISPTRSPSSPYATPSPSATYHHLTPQNQQQYQTPEFQGNVSPHYTSQASPVVPVVPQTHQLYYPSSLSPSHQLYSNMGIGNFSYAPGWHGTADYGLFQNTYHYQPAAEYIPLINNNDAR